MTNDRAIRPPPSPQPFSPAPLDFDAAMTARWMAWQSRGRRDLGLLRIRVKMIVVVATLGLVAMTASRLYWP